MRFPVPPPAVPDDPVASGQFELIINKETGNSSTGIAAVHLVMIPKSTKVLLWSRGQQPNVPAQPGTEFTVSVVYDWSVGKYWPVASESQIVKI